MNGNRVNDFSYNPLSGKLTTSLNLKNGRNTISVWAQNNDGIDEKNVRVTYEAPSNPPTVNINTPDDNDVVDKNIVTVRATVQNVTRKQDVTFKVNGQTVSNFSLSGSKINGSARLKEGKNVIIISVKNNDGQDKDQVIVTYKPKVILPKPVVKFITPSRSGINSKKQRYTVKISVENVTSKGDIQMNFNQKALTRFSYNAKKKLVTASVALVNGTNQVSIIAKNASGTATAETTINYATKPTTSQVQKPTIDITSVSQPVTNPFNPTVLKSTIIATIKNITTKDQITFVVNGKKETNFTFNPYSGKFQSTIDLKVDGSTNEFKITANNSTGSTEETYKY